MARVVALVLSDLACELVTRRHGPCPSPNPSGHASGARPFAVILADPSVTRHEATARLFAVNHVAARAGARAGQTIAEASALVARLALHGVAPAELQAALARVAEVALGFGSLVSLEAPDTVWVDVTGAAQLFGGEAALVAELALRTRELGHRVRAALAEGPRVAQLLARWSPEAATHTGLVVAPGAAAQALAPLPVVALADSQPSSIRRSGEADPRATGLPLDHEQASWLARLGVLTLGALAALPSAAVGARLAPHAARALDLCHGRDDTPLAPYHPPEHVAELTSWDEPVHGVQALGFVLRGLASRVSARLAGRGQAASALTVRIHYDRAIARLAGAGAAVELQQDLAAPLWREEDLVRVLATRLERTELAAPALGCELEVTSLVRAQAVQLDLGRALGGITALTGAEKLPVLVAELVADLGRERVGTLRVVDSHRPEARSRLGAALPQRGPTRSTRSTRKPAEPALALAAADVTRVLPTRLFAEPVPLTGPLRQGATLAIDHRLYTIEALRFEHRLDAVEWWSGHTVARDYLRLWLDNPEGGLEAYVYVDRDTGARFLQGVVD